ncbi:transcriptional regulator family: Fungal Specific TF [Penicillium cf. griseofulvum]|nr:transcriptional regulator family: Fungal Specific TF [Penicillium cf. griseofulvum]
MGSFGVGAASPNSDLRIRCASDNWRRIWDSVIGLLDKDQFLHLGYPKHAQELWWLLNATLDTTGRSDVSLRYMDSTATDDLGNLNEFIQWCHQSPS